MREEVSDGDSSLGCTSPLRNEVCGGLIELETTELNRRTDYCRSSWL
jgi:hypothetical protein